MFKPEYKTRFGSFWLRGEKCYAVFETTAEFEVANGLMNFSSCSKSDAEKHAHKGKLPIWQYGTLTKDDLWKLPMFDFEKSR